jgi:hypothetical protein
MPFLAPLVVALLFATAAAAQSDWKISEIHTGSPDFVEVVNTGPTTRPVSMLILVTANNAACPATTAGAGPAQQNGFYAATGTAMIPPGGTYVFEDLGVAGSTALTPAASGGPANGALGERMGLNLSWAGSSHGEAALYDGGSVVPTSYGQVVSGGAAQDYVCFQTVPTVGAVPFGEGFRFNPLDAGGRWYSGPVLRAPGDDVLFRIGPTDADTSADWNAGVGPHTGGAANPAGVPGAAAPGLDLELSNDGGTLSLEVRGAPATFAGVEVYNLISLAPTPCAGSGLVFGLEADVWSLLFVPVGTVPFRANLDAAGEYVFPLTIGVLLGVAVEARSLAFLPPATLVASNFVYADV